VSPKTDEGRDESSEAAATTASPAKPKKKPVRRVRVIEVIEDDDDDELDIDELLAQADAPARTPKPAEIRSEPVDEPGPATAGPVADEPAGYGPVLNGLPTDGSGGSGGANLVALIALAVAFVLATTFGAYAWMQKSDLQARQDTRGVVAKVAGTFVEKMFTLNQANSQSQSAAALALTTGDQHTRLAAQIPNFATFFAKYPTFAFSTKVKRAYVGDVNGNFADVLVTVQITISTDKGAMPGNNTPFSISLAKVAGGWKVSDMQQSDGSSTDSSGGLPGLSTPSATPSPSG
jgi:hypothetical protein